MQPIDRNDVSCYIVVYSAADKGTFHSALDLLYNIRKKHPSDLPAIILVANKADIVRSKEVGTKGNRIRLVGFCVNV